METKTINKDHSIKQSIQSVGRNRRTFLFTAIMIILLAIISAILTTFQIRRTASVSRDATVQAMVSALDFSKSNTELLITTCISQPFQEIEQNLGIIALSFSTSDEKINYSKAATARSEISAIMNNSPLIHDAFLYVYSIDSVISYAYPTTDLDSSVYRDIINSFNASGSFPSVIHYQEADIYLFGFNDTFIVARQLFSTTEKARSAIFAILDIDELGKFMKISSDDLKRIMLFDGDGTIIYPHNQDSSYMIPSRGSEDSGSEVIESISNGKYCLSSYSEGTSLTFLVETDLSNLNPPQSSFFRWIAVGAGIFCILSAILVLSVYFIRRPYKQAIFRLKESGIDDIASNEIDFMNNTITSIISKQERLNTMLQTVSQDVEDKIFIDLIHNSVPSYDSAAGILNGIDSRFRINAFFVVCIIEVISDSETEPANKFKKELTEYINNSSYKNDFSFKVINNNDPVQDVIIIQFNDPDITYPEVLNIIRKLHSNINRIIYPFAHAEFGHLYRSLFDIAFSYQEAENAILNTKTIINPIPTDYQKDPESENDTLFFEHRSSQIIKSLQIDNSEQGLQMIDDVFQRLSLDTGDMELTRSNCSIFINILIKYILSYPFVRKSVFSAEYDDFSDSINKCTESIAMIGLTHATVHSLLSAFKEQLHNQNNPYILTAQNYIKENYTNPNLTVGDIADHVRISSNYLSRLFREALDMTLLEYLTYFRIQASLDQLKNNNLTIIQIAEMNGFSSVRNYIRSFRIYYDTTPGEYRKTLPSEISS